MWTGYAHIPKWKKIAWKTFAERIVLRVKTAEMEKWELNFQQEKKQAKLFFFFFWVSIPKGMFSGDELTLACTDPQAALLTGSGTQYCSHEG